METEKKEKKSKANEYKIMAIGKELVDLISIVEEKFGEEYGFKPNIIDITNLIARRVIANKLF